MTDFVRKKGIKVLEYSKSVEPFRKRITKNAEILTTKNNRTIEIIHHSNARKEEILKKTF
jgi:hypothetical protein